MGKVTVRDIAQLAGVSTAAVSFVINGKKGVSEATRQRVQQIIRETGFVPDNNSRRFYFKKNFTVALVKSQAASMFHDLFYYEVAGGLDAACEASGYSVIFTSLREEAGELLLPEVVRTRDTDGLVFLQDIPEPIRETLRAMRIPCVVVDSPDPDGSCVTVHTDYRQAARAATRYLIDRGHSAIAFLGANRTPPFYLSTRAGYLEAMDEIGADPPQHWTQATANDDAGTTEALDAVLSQKPWPTAIFCANDMIAITAMNHAREQGQVIPRDLSFIGIDDVMTSSYVYPPLTTVRIDKFEMGKAAMELLIREISGEKAVSRLIEPGIIVERQSVYNRSANPETS